MARQNFTPKKTAIGWDMLLEIPQESAIVTAWISYLKHRIYVIKEVSFLNKSLFCGKSRKLHILAVHAMITSSP